MTLLLIIGSTVLIGAISLIGILLVVSRLDVQKLTFYLISLASGTMLGSAFIHLIPEALEQSPNRALTFTAVGVVLFFIFEKFLVWRHCHMHPPEEHHNRKTSAKMVLAGDAIHNFIDGMIVASSYLAGWQVGISATTAIILHEIPQELGDFGVLIRGGYSIRKALLANFLIAMTAVAGAVLTFFFLAALPTLQPFLVPITAGGFLYIALADLIPQLHEETEGRAGLGQVCLLVAGFLVMLLLPHGH
jgi:zinc and cadmium transporter